MFKCYITGEWDSALLNIDRCLELWDSDGPTKAIKYYMQFYKFQAPSSWSGSWVIDDLPNLDQVVQDEGFEDETLANESPMTGGAHESMSGPNKGNTSGASSG